MAAEIAARSRRLSRSWGSTSLKRKSTTPERLAGHHDRHGATRAGRRARRARAPPPRRATRARRRACARARSGWAATVSAASATSPRREAGSSSRPLAYRASAASTAFVWRSTTSRPSSTTCGPGSRWKPAASAASPSSQRSWRASWRRRSSCSRRSAASSARAAASPAPPRPTTATSGRASGSAGRRNGGRPHAPARVAVPGRVLDLDPVAGPGQDAGEGGQRRVVVEGGHRRGELLARARRRRERAQRGVDVLDAQRRGTGQRRDRHRRVVDERGEGGGGEPRPRRGRPRAGDRGGQRRPGLDGAAHEEHRREVGQRVAPRPRAVAQRDGEAVPALPRAQPLAARRRSARRSASR